MRQIIRIAVGVFLCAAGIIGGIYSIRTARAQHIYHSVRYGQLSDVSSDAVLKQCEKSYKLYPYSYDLSIQACLKMWPGLSSENSSESKAAAASIELWCDRGLGQNPYHRTLNQTKADMISLRSSADAADYWMGFIDNQFWNTKNIALLVKYYSQAGRLAEASEFLDLLKGHSKYKEASASLRKAWAAEMLR